MDGCLQPRRGLGWMDAFSPVGGWPSKPRRGLANLALRAELRLPDRGLCWTCFYPLLVWAGFLSLSGEGIADSALPLPLPEFGVNPLWRNWHIGREFQIWGPREVEENFCRLQGRAD